MEGIDNRPKSSKTIGYDRPESSMVFKIAWYTVASKPNVLLNEYSEAESQIFKGKAMFTVPLDEERAGLRLWVEEAQTTVEITVWSENENTRETYIENITQEITENLNKYNQLSEEIRQKLKRALISKMCWDRVVFEILNKAPRTAVYYQVAHGREMLVKATEGEEIQTTSLTTSAWLTRIEEYPEDKPLPAEVATELAKKSIEWKKETHAVISKYL